MIKPFDFQKFKVSQAKGVFRVGTDAVLLGALANVENSQNILEVGTGTGIVSLMISQRNSSAKITAIDIDENAAKLASQNFENSIFKERLSAKLSDFKHFESEEKFDLIISNPPYFEENNSEKDKIARQTVALSFENLVINARKWISDSGIFSVILPSDSSENFIKICQTENFSLARKVNIYGIKGGNIKRNILEFSPSPKNLVEENFTVEKSPRKFTDEYLSLTKEFHKFK